MNLSGERRSLRRYYTSVFNANHADVSWEVAMYSLGVQDGEIQNVVFCA